MTVNRIMPVLRDVVCLGLGTYGFAWQVRNGADLVLMLGCILTLAGPMVMATWALRGNTPDSGQSQQSAVPASSSPSPSPSSPGAGGESG